MKAFIKAVSYYLPERVFSNEDFFNEFPSSRDNGNLQKLGISERHIVAPGHTSSDLAVESALKLFSEHNIDKSSIDFIIFCSLEFDYFIPTTACIIQDRLGIPTSCGALDVNLGCSGYVYGLSLAKGLVESCACSNVLFLTSSTLTKTFHPKDKSSRFLFGDGAAATLICGRETEGIGSFVFGTDGHRADKIIIKDGLGRNPLNPESMIDIEDEFGNVTNNASFYMNGSAVFHFGMKTVPAMIAELLAKSKLGMDDIDHFIFHQTNQFMNDMIRKKANIPAEKFVTSIAHCGNTVSASIPIVIDDATRSGRIKKGDKLLLAAFGSGLSWAGTIVQL